MTPSQSAACARCDKQDCSVVVILPAVNDKMKRVEHSKQRLELVCPACHRFFAIPFRNVEYRDVTDEQLTQGYIDGTSVDSKVVH